MGELYNPYPKLPKNIRQIGERDQVMKLYVEDYVNTYLKRLYPKGGQDLRAGLLLGEIRTEDGVPYVFVDGALEMEGVTRDGEQVEFTEEDWKRAYQNMEQMFPKRKILGWFLCGVQGSALSPLNYWKQHGQYFSAKNQLMYLNSGLEGEEALYISAEDGFYCLRGYCIYYERNQMMQDYMVSRKEARRVETGARDAVIQDFRQRMDEKKTEVQKKRSAIHVLGTACGALSVLVLAGGVVSFNNYQKMKDMESVIASVIPEGTGGKWSSALTKGETYTMENREPEFEAVPGEVYPTQAEIIITPESGAAGGGTGGAADGASGGAACGVTGGTSSGISGESQIIAGGNQTAAGKAGGSGQPGAPAGESAGAPVNEASDASLDATPVQIPADAVSYIVQEGETLYDICMERYHTPAKIQEICQWNQLPDENRIASGQELMIPASE